MCKKFCSSLYIICGVASVEDKSLRFRLRVVKPSFSADYFLGKLQNL